MPRSLWNGTITFGVIAVPVKLYTATESKTVRFREVHLDDEGKIEHRRFCSKEDEEVALRRGRQGLRGPRGRVRRARQGGDRGGGGRPRASDRARGVRRGRGDRPGVLREDLLPGRRRRGHGRLPAAPRRARRRPGAPASAASRSTTASTSPRSGRSTASSPCTRCASPTSSSRARTSSSTPPSRKPQEKEIEMAGRLVDSLHEKFDPGKRKDTYREAVLEMIERKASGKKPRKAKEKPPEETPDLMAALEASLAGKKGEPMPRPIWSGSLSFGLVNVPVALFSAARDLGAALQPAARAGRRAHRDAPVLRGGGQGGAVRGDRPRLRPRGRQDASWSPTRSSRRSRRGARGRSTSRRSPTSPRSTRSTSTTLLPRAGRRLRRHPPRLPAAGRGDGPRGPGGDRPLRDAHEGVPRGRSRCATAGSRSRRCAGATRSARRRASTPAARSPRRRSSTRPSR